MALLDFLFKSQPKSASAAKERLQIIIARERNGGREGYDFLPALREELIAEKMKSKFLFWSPYSTREKAIEALSSDIWSKYSLIVLRGCVWEDRALDLVAASKVAPTVKVPAEYISVFWRDWT